MTSCEKTKHVCSIISLPTQIFEEICMIYTSVDGRMQSDCGGDH